MMAGILPMQTQSVKSLYLGMQWMYTGRDHSISLQPKFQNDTLRFGQNLVHM